MRAARCHSHAEECKARHAELAQRLCEIFQLYVPPEEDDLLLSESDNSCDEYESETDDESATESDEPADQAGSQEGGVQGEEVEWASATPV